MLFTATIISIERLTIIAADFFCIFQLKWKLLFSRPVWALKIYYRVYKSYINPVHTALFYFITANCTIFPHTGIAHSVYSLVYVLAESEIGVRFSAVVRESLQSVRTSSGEHPASYAIDIWGSFLGGKAAEA
jgi:hypothetical protein